MVKITQQDREYSAMRMRFDLDDWPIARQETYREQQFGTVRKGYVCEEIDGELKEDNMTVNRLLKVSFFPPFLPDVQVARRGRRNIGLEDLGQGREYLGNLTVTLTRGAFMEEGCAVRNHPPCRIDAPLTRRNGTFEKR